MKRKQSQTTPPSSFFPFQAYAGNPDPGMPIPRTMDEFTKPVAPFMATDSLSRVPSSNSLYKAPIPRSSSVQSFRTPFLAPSSRPTSSLWSPPSYPTLPVLPKPKPPLPSTALTQPLQSSDKPWLNRTQPGTHSSYFLTLSFIILGTLAAGLIAFIGYSTVPLLPENHLCLVLNEQFSSSSLDDSIWNYDVQLANSDFGPSQPGEIGFQMSTKSSENIYLSNSNLYIVPTLSSQDTSTNFSLPDCTSQTDCTSNQIPPIASARIHTKSKKSLRFGRIFIRAKLPTGDWLHPRIYLLPESDDPYGSFPASGFIDILNARGNDMNYDAQGANFVRAAVGYGPLLTVQNQIFGWVGRKRGGLFGEQFHDFVLEWDEKFIRVYVDKRTQPMLEIPIGPISSNPFASPSSFYFPSSKSINKPSFWDKASFPKTVHNSTDGISGTEIVLPNPYQNASYAAPFDQKFYLVLDLGVGGTKQGWFPDGVGGKPWLDGQSGEAAMRSFERDRERWLTTWPEVGGRLERALRMYVFFFPLLSYNSRLLVEIISRCGKSVRTFFFL